MSQQATFASLRTLVRGGGTLYRRRGLRYIAYLVAHHGRLRFLYRYAWGPRSWTGVRALFDAAAPLASRPAPDGLLRQLGLLDADLDALRDERTAAALMDRAHAAGVTGLGFLMDESASRPPGPPRLHRWRGAYYLAARDRDRRRFNRRFGTALLTEHAARLQLRTLRSRVRNGYRDYAPIDFGGGLAFGLIASTDSGTGRWDFFNRSVVSALVAGRRVLDLGCNNGSLTLMMLRAGASEVVAVELSPDIAAVARFNAQILAWRDARDYRCEILTGDMRLWLTEDLGPFDVVTAFCSLYYLPEADIARIVRKARDSGAIMILQANDSIDNLPAQTDTLRRLLLENGYEDVRVAVYPKFARPILVASAGEAVGAIATAS